MPDYSGETQAYVQRQKAAEEQQRFEKTKTLSCLASRDHPAALYPLGHMRGNAEIFQTRSPLFGAWPHINFFALMSLLLRVFFTTARCSLSPNLRYTSVVGTKRNASRHAQNSRPGHPPRDGAGSYGWRYGHAVPPRHP